MPIYDLRCPACDREYRLSASMREKSEKRVPCPDCGSYDLETVFKAPPAYVKGKGSAGARECPNLQTCGVCPHAG